MFSVIKFFWFVFKTLKQSGSDLLNPDVNPLRHMPVWTKVGRRKDERINSR